MILSEVKGVEKYISSLSAFILCIFPVCLPIAVAVSLSCSCSLSLVKDYNNLRSQTQSTKQSEETLITEPAKARSVATGKNNGRSVTKNHISFSINWEESLSALKQLGDHPNVDKWSNSLRPFAVSIGERSETTERPGEIFQPCRKQISLGQSPPFVR